MSRLLRPIAVGLLGLVMLLSIGCGPDEAHTIDIGASRAVAKKNGMPRTRPKRGSEKGKLAGPPPGTISPQDR